MLCIAQVSFCFGLIGVFILSVMLIKHERDRANLIGAYKMKMSKFDHMANFGPSRANRRKSIQGLDDEDWSRPMELDEPEVIEYKDNPEDGEVDFVVK